MSRLIGVSAHRLAGLAICDDFMRKLGDFEAACQGIGVSVCRCNGMSVRRSVGV